MLRIGQAEYGDLRRHGEEAYPHESCGVLLGWADGDQRVVSRVVRCRNVRSDSPRDRYGIDPREVLRAERQGRERGEDIVGFYHSHPDHPARWSAIDLAEAHWTGCSYLITGVERGRADATRSFLLEGGGEEVAKRFDEEEIQVSGSTFAGPDTPTARPQREGRDGGKGDR